MLSTLNVSYTGLTSAKTAVENVSNNIANENTPGYKKRIVQLSELDQIDSRFTGRGVSADSAYRVTSQYMYDKLMSENSRTNYYDKLSSMLGNVEAFFQETVDSGISADLNRYLQSIENLRSNPSSEIYSTTLSSSGKALTESLKNLYDSVEQQQKLEKDELNLNVETINDILKNIGQVNEKIVKLGATNDLLDKRDQLELELSNYVDIDVDRTEGDYELKIGGVFVITNNTNVREIQVNDELTKQVDKYVLNSDNDSIVQFSDGAFNNSDKISYKLNNQYEVSVQFGEAILDANGNAVDLGNGTNVVDDTNYLRALVYKINNDPEMKDNVTAYNGTRFLSNGDLVTNDTRDNYLRIESNVAGVDGNFDGRIVIEENDGTDVTSRNSFYKNEDYSTEANDKVFLSVYNQEMSLKSGIVKAQTENLSSANPNNKYQTYLNDLDAFAQTLSDISDSYILNSNGEYIYGEAGNDKNLGTINSIGLFTGSSVKDLVFNSNKINDLTQQDLDYLSTIQWKKDLSFTGKEQDSSVDNVTSLAEFFQNIKVNVSSNKESNDFLLETQNNVEITLQSSYDQIVKVDKDEEMLNLMKFQAAYTANAKVVTAIDEMIQVLLGLKR